MKSVWMVIAAGVVFAALLPAVEKEKKGDLSGTWVLDPARSDSGREMPRSGRVGGIPGNGSGYPGGIGLPGVIGGLPGSSYPGIGYPGSRPAGGRYPGGRDPQDGGDGRGTGIPGDRLQNLKLQISQNDKEVQTIREFTEDGEDRTVSQKFTLDGTETTNPASNGRGEFVSTSSWKSNRLVNSGYQNADRGRESYRIDVKEEYSISKDGKTLTIRTTKTSPRGEITSRQVFNRQDDSESKNQNTD